MTENGEKLRICPAKVEAEDSRYLREVGIPALSLEGSSIPDAGYAERARNFVPATAKQLSCPAECSGAVTQPRTIFGGRIRLPSFFDIKICPLKQAGS